MSGHRVTVSWCQTTCAGSSLIGESIVRPDKTSLPWFPMPAIAFAWSFPTFPQRAMMRNDLMRHDCFVTQATCLTGAAAKWAASSGSLSAPPTSTTASRSGSHWSSPSRSNHRTWTRSTNRGEFPSQYSNENPYVDLFFSLDAYFINDRYGL